MAAGIDSTVHDMDWIVCMIDEVAPKPVRPLRYKQPKAVRLVDALPRTASGKVKKDELRKGAAT